ncbi:Superkiller viralicidic activity 2-like 2 [Porphyridium purpureum]|uniref:Superkiller viralicidic activity 2-like 2 n=1 Tax=Porphyridium purpureum TaxID=35688 RepID=A0A5J4YIN4_PORPP|nr:Superkiller viralicidic activity 2-like 2 [Porphyridium purpureum]|eukprot:POR0773..scf297_16
MDEILFDVFQGGKRKAEPSDGAAARAAKEARPSAEARRPAAKNEALESNRQMKAEAHVVKEHEGSAPLVAKTDREDRPRPYSFGVRVESKGTFCTHDVSLPAGHTMEEYERNVKAKQAALDASAKGPAKHYKFTLDAFQQESVNCLEKNESVLVAAHTSAGKTAIAEYAIAMSFREKQRVIYTSPIKALSNQKFRELQEEFEDVGLMTGDVTINMKASCLVMTTEILRSMLYRGSELVHEIAWVIFDEVHYMRDKERGVVWEETIILVPENVRFVFLSATIPNAREFSEWISQLKRQPCHTVYTDTRPVPLQHYLFASGSSGLHLVVNEKGEFLENSFERALAELSSNTENTQAQLRTTISGKAAAQARLRQTHSKSMDCGKLLNMLVDKGYQPVIVFAFARKETEQYATRLAKSNFNTEEEADLVQQVFDSAMEALSAEDQSLPQLTDSLPLLKRGVGIHHSGLLPILKELVEILFQEGLIKVLFATETFAMGLNMPAKTVVFTAVRKYDGEKNRLISGGEYIQMSGRAGRRGLDERGMTVIMIDEKLEPADAKSILKGVSLPLKSTFKLKYNMLLNLLRSEEADPEYVITRSFAQFQADAALPDNEKHLVDLERQKEAIESSFPTKLEDVQMYVRLERTRKKLMADYRRIVYAPKHVNPWLERSRLVSVCDFDTDEDWGWGIVIGPPIERQNIGASQRMSGLANSADRWFFTALLLCVPGSDANGQRPTPAAHSPAGGHWLIVTCSLKLLRSVSAIKIQGIRNHDALASFEARKAIGARIQETLKRKNYNPEILDAVHEMHIADPQLPHLLKRISKLDEMIRANPVHLTYGEAERKELVVKYDELSSVLKQIKATEIEVLQGKGLILTQELRQMTRVLQRLLFVDQDNIVTVKGRVAAEVQTGDELVLTELMLNGSFNELSTPVLVSVLSCFVFDENVDESYNPFVVEALRSAYGLVEQVARHVGTQKAECKLNIDIDEYVKTFRSGAMGVVYQWCMGKSFQEVASMTDMFEGSIIRVFRRLEELLRQLGAAAKGIGNTELHAHFEAAGATLKRGVAFQASLYL